ncbi:MAG: acyl-ACP--UDP-N-acetylglucosamine O-acyltransferase [Planctomycetota bacterium]|jgi:UDP-N-acetylglucosamine acyltransferase
MGVHPTAIVADGAEIDEEVEIGPYCVIGPMVRLGRGCRLLSHVVIEGDTWLGEGCILYPQAVLGTTPQDTKLPSDPRPNKLRIGSSNQIREHVTIHGGTPHGTNITRVGDHNMFLAGSHLGHDTIVGNHTVFTNGAMAAGHTEIQDHVILGAMVGIHQFARVGQYAMIGAGAMLSKDAPPYSLVQGDRARLVSVNVVGLRRAGFAGDRVTVVKRAYRTLFWHAGTLRERIARLKELGEGNPEVQIILDFIDGSRRGLLMPRRRHEPREEETLQDG